MENSINNLEPKKVFKYFSDICKIPHGSGNLDGIVNYLVDFAKNHNLKYTVDNVKNVIIYSKDDQTHSGEQSRRGELCEPVILQAHTDMVCVKTPSSTIDMSKDSLDIYVDGDYLRARDTSLGADDGIGVAIILAILDDDDNTYPPIEALFTSDEETGMYGAIGVDGKLFKSKRLINIDSENENELTVSCAGGSHCISELKVERLKVDYKKYLPYEVLVAGGLGGHSGMEIHKGRANAICEMAHVLKCLEDEGVDFCLLSISAGKFINVICPEAECKLFINLDDEVKFKNLISKLNSELKSEYSLCDPNIELSCTGEFNEPKNYTGEFNEPLTKDSASRIIDTLLSLPQGLIEISQEFINLPWTSLNLGVIDTKADKITLATLVRSNDDIKRNKLVKKYETIIKNANGSMKVEGSYPAWRYNKDSKLKSSMIEAYKDVLGKDVEVVATHGGLECGLLMERIKDLEAVSIGPTLYSVHSTDEKLLISSVKNVYNFLKKYLSIIGPN